MLGFEHGSDVETFEFAVCDGSDRGIKCLIMRELVDHFETVLVLDGGGVSPRVEDGDVEVVFLEGANNVDDFGVADVGAVFLEGETEDDDVAA